MKKYALAIALFNPFILFCHEGHDHGIFNWLEWIGGFHFIFLHFPIALIVMTAVAEILFLLRKNPSYNATARFMLIAAAITAVPTAIFGLIYSYSADYEAFSATLLFWHMWLGISTVLVTLMTLYLREKKGLSTSYYMSLFFLTLLLLATTMLGGCLTFGSNHLIPIDFFLKIPPL